MIFFKQEIYKKNQTYFKTFLNSNLRIIKLTHLKFHKKNMIILIKILHK